MLRVFQISDEMNTWVIVDDKNIEDCNLCDIFDCNGQELGCEECGCDGDDHLKCRALMDYNNRKSYIIPDDVYLSELDRVLDEEEKYFLENYEKIKDQIDTHEVISTVAIDGYEYIHSNYSHFIWECMIRDDYDDEERDDYD